MQSDANEKLLSCPFCNAADYAVGTTQSYNLANEPKDWMVECSECAGFGPTADTEAEAITRWNTRALSALRTPSELERVTLYGDDALAFLAAHPAPKPVVASDLEERLREPIRFQGKHVLADLQNEAADALATLTARVALLENEIHNLTR